MLRSHDYKHSNVMHNFSVRPLYDTVHGNGCNPDDDVGVDILGVTKANKDMSYYFFVCSTNHLARISFELQQCVGFTIVYISYF